MVPVASNVLRAHCSDSVAMRKLAIDGIDPLLRALVILAVVFLVVPLEVNEMALGVVGTLVFSAWLRLPSEARAMTGVMV
mmetsp:Transcript_45145/g.125218  ORF Transcript_45145/g.125218 Transcript_45145/m.125218 type:complete len:80 (-) Transcript_45145:76-315(-)